MYCVLYNHPSFNSVVRAISSNAQIEAGLNDIDMNRSSVPLVQVSARKRCRKDGITSVAAALSKIAETSTSQQPIVFQDSSSVPKTGPNIMHLESATRLVSAISRLTYVESKHTGGIDSIPLEKIDPAKNTRWLLKNRLAQTHKFIMFAMYSMNKTSEIVDGN